MPSVPCIVLSLLATVVVLGAVVITIIPYSPGPSLRQSCIYSDSCSRCLTEPCGALNVDHKSHCQLNSSYVRCIWEQGPFRFSTPLCLYVPPSEISRFTFASVFVSHSLKRNIDKSFEKDDATI